MGEKESGAGGGVTARGPPAGRPGLRYRV